MADKMMLSICIPTFNRARFLKPAIESVLCQVNESNKEQIEIVISDNASEDDTKHIVERIKDKASIPVLYNRNDVNLAFDRNILKVVDLANGAYCLILGDDDELIPGSIDFILKQINNTRNCDVIAANRIDLDFTLTHPFRDSPILSENTIKTYDFGKIDATKYLKNVNKMTGIFSYISNIVFNRSKWQRVEEKNKYVGTGYIHVYMFMEILWGKVKGKLLYLPEKIVKTRWGNDRSVLGNDLFERVERDVSTYHRIAKDVLKSAGLVRYVDNLILKNDGFSWTVRVKIEEGSGFYTRLIPFLFKYFWNYPLFWLKIVPLMFVPGTILKAFRWLYRKYVKNEPL